jgi:hypothetical protein
MIGKLICLSLLLANFAGAQNVEEFLAKIKAERGFEENPCAGRAGAHFARNTRGCSWYFACGGSNSVLREDRCGPGLR